MGKPPLNQISMPDATREAYPEVAAWERWYKDFGEAVGWPHLHAYDVGLLLGGLDVRGLRVLECGARGSLFGPVATKHAEAVTVLDNFVGWDDDLGDEGKWRELWGRAAFRPERLTVTRGDFTALPFAGGSFDLVAAICAVEHAQDDAAAAREMARVLAPGGLLFLSTDMGPETRWCGSGWQYTETGLRRRLIRPSGLVLEGPADFRFDQDDPAREVGVLNDAPYAMAFMWLRKPMDLRKPDRDLEDTPRADTEDQAAFEERRRRWIERVLIRDRQLGQGGTPLPTEEET